MKQKLNLTILLLLTISFAFAQQQIHKSKSNVKNNLVKVNSTEAPTTETPQAKTEGVPIRGVLVKGGHNHKIQNKTEGGPIGGIIIKGGKNPGASMYFIVTTTKDGSFSAKLDEGNYIISVNADELKKTILELKREGETINGATFMFDLPANFEFSGTEKPNENGEYVAPKFEFTIKVPKEGITFSGKLLTTSTAGLSIKPTINEKGTGGPKQAGF